MTDKTPGEKAADRLDQERLDFIQKVQNAGMALSTTAAKVAQWSDEPGARSLFELVAHLSIDAEALQALAIEHRGAPWARAERPVGP